MRIESYIVILFALVMAMLPVNAKEKPQPQAIVLSVEEEQQFTYYWYAAQQAIREERFADAYALLEFCHMLKPNDGTTLMFLGVLYDGMGQREKAQELFRLAFEAAPRDQWYKYSEVLLAQRTEEGKNEALRVLEKAYNVQKPDAEEELLEQLKRLYMADKQWKKALAMQDELDAQRGFDGYSALTRYRIYLMWNKPKKALQILDNYLENDPTNIQFLQFRLAVMEQMKVKQEDLYAMYKRILALDPYNLLVLNNYAYHLATHGGDLKEAERMSAITIREEPGNAVYLDTYGWILYLQGQRDLAKFYLNKALQNALDGTKEEILKHLKEIEN